MPRGFTDYIFVGGPHDGIVEKSIPVFSTRPPPKKIGFQSNHHFVQGNDEGMLLVEQHKNGRLHKDWISYSIDIYEKEEKKNRHKPGTIYKYLKQEIIERCVAITKKKTRCMKPALSGKDYCCILHKRNHKGKKMGMIYEELVKKWLSEEEFEFEGEKVKIVPGKRGVQFDGEGMKSFFELTNGKRISVKKPDESEHDNCHFCKKSLVENYSGDVGIVKAKDVGETNYICEDCLKEMQKNQAETK